MIVAHGHEDAAVFVGAKAIAVAHHVRGAVNPGRLAIPHGVDAIHQRVREEFQLLCTPDGCCRQVFVNTGLEYHAGFFHALFLAP